MSPNQTTTGTTTAPTSSGDGTRGEAIRFEGVTKRFGAATAVADLNLTIAAGEFFSLLGPSGCGKTTTLRMVAGFEQPTEGEVFLEGNPVATVPPFKRNVNTVFQSYALFEHLDVRNNVAFGLKRRKVAPAEIETRVAEALELVQLRGREAARPNELSGGQQQRVALARAIVNQPRVLLLDEPLGALDLKLREQMQVELKSIQQEDGITFIYVTHDQEEALTMSNRIAVFNQGRVEQIGEPTEIYEHPQNPFVAGFVGVSNLLERDGRRFTVRPEKVTISDNGKLPEGLHTEQGTIRDVAYAGMITRYLVDLDAGGELQVVRQNLETSSVEAQAQRGRKVTIGWRADQTVAVEGEEERK